MMIGFMGGRGVGKSTLANHLVQEHGFARAHPFDGGKAASLAYFMHLGATPDMAEDMIMGSLKDQSCDLLPLDADGHHHTPRYFLEKFGAFMGTDLGYQWTLGREIDRLQSQGHERIIFESIAFEAAEFQSLGGIIIEVQPKNILPENRIIGIETDKAVRMIMPDHVFQNDFSARVACEKDSWQIFELLDQFLEDRGLLHPAPVLEFSI
jgi:hypothetical protein